MEGNLAHKFIIFDVNLIWKLPWKDWNDTKFIMQADAIRDIEMEIILGSRKHEEYLRNRNMCSMHRLWEDIMVWWKTVLMVGNVSMHISTWEILHVIQVVFKIYQVVYFTLKSSAFTFIFLIPAIMSYLYFSTRPSLNACRLHFEYNL